MLLLLALTKQTEVHQLHHFLQRQPVNNEGLGLVEITTVATKTFPMVLPSALLTEVAPTNETYGPVFVCVYSPL